MSLIISGLDTNSKITKFDGLNWRTYSLIDIGLPEEYSNPECIAIDKAGNVWICTDGSGLIKFRRYKLGNL